MPKSRTELTADCTRCAALCCVATAFDASEDFAFSKPAGARCPHLAGTRCAIHAERPARGFSGCVAFDCHGAGQRATRAFAAEPEEVRHAAFLVLCEVHGWLWLLAEAAALRRVPPELRAALEAELATLHALGDRPAAELLSAELGSIEGRVRALLQRVGEALGGRAGWSR